MKGREPVRSPVSELRTWNSFWTFSWIFWPKNRDAEHWENTFPLFVCFQRKYGKKFRWGASWCLNSQDGWFTFLSLDFCWSVRRWPRYVGPLNSGVMYRQPSLLLALPRTGVRESSGFDSRCPNANELLKVSCWLQAGYLGPNLTSKHFPLPTLEISLKFGSLNLDKIFCQVQCWEDRGLVNFRKRVITRVWCMGHAPSS